MLQGKTVAITRSEDDSQEFVELMTKNNATPISLPTIELVSKGEKIVTEFLDTIKRDDPDYSVFMSSKAVKLLFDTAKQASQYDKLRLAVANTIVIAVGPKTRVALEQEGIKVAYMPSHFSSVGVGEVFTRLNSEGKKVVIPRSGASTPFLKELLEKIGLEVIEIHLYDVCAFRDQTKWNEFRDLFSQGKIDGVVFTSASSVRAFFEIMSKDHSDSDLLASLGKTNVVAIGPFTSDELKRFKVRNQISDVHTVSGAFETIKKILS